MATLPAGYTFTLYKYLKREHADGLVNGTSRRLGSLKHFREMEALDPTRGDSREGTDIEHENVGDGRLRTDRGVTPFVNQHFLRGFQGTSIGVNYTLETRFNAYIFSTSDTCSREVMNRFAGADTCVRIQFPEDFFKAITTHLIRDGMTITQQGMSACRYADRIREAGKKRPDDLLFLKEVRFVNEREHRMVWIPKGDILPYHDIACRRAARFCSIVPVVE